MAQTPYYEEPGIQVFQADCLDVLPCLPPAVVITDPPYNVGKNYADYDDAMPLDDWVDYLGARLAVANATEVIFFPGTKNLFAVPRILARATLDLRHVLGWHKKEFAGDKWSAGPAMCWEPIIWAGRGPRVFNRVFGTIGRDFLVVNATHGDPWAKRHPCQKPLPVMLWLINLFVPEKALVVDPFLGSGTTLQAAKELGRPAIGIDCSDVYCALTVQRLAQGVLAL